MPIRDLIKRDNTELHSHTGPVDLPPQVGAMDKSADRCQLRNSKCGGRFVTPAMAIATPGFSGQASTL